MLFIISSPFPSLGLVLLSSIPCFPINVLRACLQGPREIGLQVKEKGGPAVPPTPPPVAAAPGPPTSARNTPLAVCGGHSQSWGSGYTIGYTIAWLSSC